LKKSRRSEISLQGDIVAIVDANGTLQAEYTYDAWGTVLSASGYLAGANPIRYRGYYYDSEIGSYYLQTRYYSTKWKRFWNADCLFIAGDAITGTNMYAYCRNNPVMRVDPSGMKDNWLANIVLFFTFIAPVFYMVFQTDNNFSLSDDQVANGLFGFMKTMLGLGATVSDIVEFLGSWATNLGLMERPKADDTTSGPDILGAINAGIWDAIVAAAGAGALNWAAAQSGIQGGDLLTSTASAIIAGGAFVLGFVGYLTGLR